MPAPSDDVVDLDLDLRPLTSLPPTSPPADPFPGRHAPPPASRGPRRRWMVAAPVVVAVLAAGLLAHRGAQPAAPPAVDREALRDTVSLEASQAAVRASLRAVAPQAVIDWSSPVIGIKSDSGAVLDVQRSGQVAGSAAPRGDDSPAPSTHVGYRVVTGVPKQLSRQPCLLPSVDIEVWQFDQGGDAALACEPATGPGAGAWAVRQGTAPEDGGLHTVVDIAEVLLVHRGRTIAVATWSVGHGAATLLDTSSLRRVALALDAAS